MESLQIKNIRLQFHRSSTAVRVAVLTVVLLSTATLVSIRLATSSTLSRAEALRAEAMVLEQETNRLKQNIQQLNTVDGVIRIAQEELGLVQPGTILFDTNQETESGGSK